MPKKDITLEILVRSGRVYAVKSFAKQHNLKEEETEQKEAEALLYLLANGIRTDWGSIYIDGITNWLEHPGFKEYFNKTKNTELMCEIVKSLEEATNSAGEDAPYLLAISVLGAPALAQAIKRTVGNLPEINNTLNDLITGCYQVVFSASANNKYFIEHYLPLLKPWQDCIDQENLVKTVLQNFAEDEGILDYDYKKEFFYAAIDSLIELFGRQHISESIADVFKEPENEEMYKQLLNDKKIDPVQEKPKTKPSKIAEALNAYEQDWPNKHAVQQLEQQLGGKGQQEVARRLGGWFLQERFEHVRSIVTYDKILYDVQTVKQELTIQIANALSAKDYTKLAFALELPEQLIDRTRQELQSFIAAYDLSKPTK